LTTNDVEKVIRKSRSVVRGPRLATMLRLTFHDCVGGCDGCINVEDSSNNGLADLIADLEEVFQKNDFNDTLSRADMWALLGVWAVQQTIDNSNDQCDDCGSVPDIEVPYTYGRQDCPTAPYTSAEENLPSATLNYDGLMKYYSEEFGFTPLEVTALMGAHTLGRADIFNSGYSGPWVSGQTSMFNNRYYANLVGTSWRLNSRACTELNGVAASLCGEGQTTNWQYSIGGVGFNLPADMALYQNFTVDSDGKPSCDYEDCDLSDTASYVEDFASSNDYFIQEFSNVYAKVLSHGYDNLEVVF